MSKDNGSIAGDTPEQKKYDRCGWAECLEDIKRDGLEGHARGYVQNFIGNLRSAADKLERLDGPITDALGAIGGYVDTMERVTKEHTKFCALCELAGELSLVKWEPQSGRYQNPMKRLQELLEQLPDGPDAQ